jgi:hypothetical protein
MKLEEFIEKFIQPNSLVRLLHRDEDGGYKTILEDWNCVSMEWEISQGKSDNRHYINNNVIGIKDIIVYKCPYSEAINIVIEKLDPQPQVEEVIDEYVNNGASYEVGCN